MKLAYSIPLLLALSGQAQAEVFVAPFGGYSFGGNNLTIGPAKARLITTVVRILPRPVILALCWG